MTISKSSGLAVGVGVGLGEGVTPKSNFDCPEVGFEPALVPPGPQPDSSAKPEITTVRRSHAAILSEPPSPIRQDWSEELEHLCGLIHKPNGQFVTNESKLPNGAQFI